MSRLSTSLASVNSGPPSIGRGLRTVWSTEDDYKFVYTLSKNTECNAKMGLVLNHKYVEPSIIAFVQQLLNQNMGIDEISEKLAKKFPNKSQDLRSISCLQLLIDLKDNLPDFAYSQLNHKHINMWTRSIVPFRNLFSSGSLFKGKSMFHKDCKRFVKCMLDFLMYEQAIGDRDNYESIFSKGPSQGNKLLEQWLNAMFKVHGKDMAGFLLCCCAKLAREFLRNAESQMVAQVEKDLLNKQNPPVAVLILVMRNYLSKINKYIGESNETSYSYLSVDPAPRNSLETSAVAPRMVAGGHNAGPTGIPRVASRANIMMEPGNYAGVHRPATRETFCEPPAYPHPLEYREPQHARFMPMRGYPQHQEWRPSMPMPGQHSARFYPPEPSYDYESAYHANYAYGRPEYVNRSYMASREQEYLLSQQRFYEQQHFAREQATTQQRMGHPGYDIVRRDPGYQMNMPRSNQYRSHPYAHPDSKPLSTFPAPAYVQKSHRRPSIEYPIYANNRNSKPKIGAYSTPVSVKQSPAMSDKMPEIKNSIGFISNKDTLDAQAPRASSAELSRIDKATFVTPVTGKQDRWSQPIEMASSTTVTNEQSQKRLADCKPLFSDHEKGQYVKPLSSCDKPVGNVPSTAADPTKKVMVISNNKAVSTTDEGRPFSVYKFRYPSK